MTCAGRDAKSAAPNRYAHMRVIASCMGMVPLDVRDRTRPQQGPVRVLNQWDHAERVRDDRLLVALSPTAIQQRRGHRRRRMSAVCPANDLARLSFQTSVGV